MTEIRPSLVIFALLTLLTGVAYPALITGVAQLLFPGRANGSLIQQGERIVGSHLIGQSFASPKYFWSRPSATSPQPYNSAASSGSNQGPTNPTLEAAVRERVAALRAADPDNMKPIPIDLVTASASGLDPDISPAAAEYQVTRIARERQRTPDEVRKFVAKATRARTFGILGEPRVNVLELNLALDDALIHE